MVVMSQYINYIIPKVYKKSFLMSTVLETISNKRKKFSRYLLMKIIHPLLMNSQILYNFLSIKDEKEFKKKIKKIECLQYFEYGDKK